MQGRKPDEGRDFQNLIATGCEDLLFQKLLSFIFYIYKVFC